LPWSDCRSRCGHWLCCFKSLDTLSSMCNRFGLPFLMISVCILVGYRQMMVVVGYFFVWLWPTMGVGSLPMITLAGVQETSPAFVLHWLLTPHLTSDDKDLGGIRSSGNVQKTSSPDNLSPTRWLSSEGLLVDCNISITFSSWTFLSNQTFFFPTPRPSQHDSWSSLDHCLSAALSPTL
jgi:hypothetical protein